MFRLNLKIAWRNLWKNKVYTAVNVLGLALGLSGFIFILLNINHEKSYNTWDKELDKVYQVQELDTWSLKEGKEEWNDGCDLNMIDIIKSSYPTASAITFINRDYNDPLSIIIDNKEPFLQHNMRLTDSAFFSVFPFNFIYGSANSAFKLPDNIVISEEFYRLHFGNENPIGKVIKISQASLATPKQYVVSGVVAKPNTPSTVEFSLLALREFRVKFNEGFESFPMFIKVSDNPDIDNMDVALQSLYAPYIKSMFSKRKQPAADYYKNGLQPKVRLKSFYSLYQQPISGEDWLSAIRPVILLSSLLLLISIVNFINMFTAQAVSRAKEIGVRKVIGAHRVTLIAQFLLETALQCFAALVLGIVILELLLPYLNIQFAMDLSITNGNNATLVIAQLIGLVIMITLLAGIYPALYLSSYQPSQVLKGNVAEGSGKFKLRTILTGIQFVIAVGFLIGIMIITRQINYLESRDPGFNAEAVIYTKDWGLTGNMVSLVKSIDGVRYIGNNTGNVTRNINLPGNYKYKGEVKELSTVLVSQEGLSVIGAKLVKGRLFSNLHKQDLENTVILNETLEKQYGRNMIGERLQIGDSISAEVVGVIKDIQVSGFDELIEPRVYTAAEKNATGYPADTRFYHLISYDQQKEKYVLDQLNKLWKLKYKGYPLTYTFLKDDLKMLLVKHDQFKQMVKMFSILSIGLSLIGLFALAAFMTKQRTKEIAIRKVMGADDKDIFLLLNKGYLWLMLGANIIAWPLIYVALQHWLADFAYRIDIPLLPFVIAFVVSLIITVITVSLQVNNAVKANPVRALKYE
ncbi:MAG: ABC transporter permease [Pedobacter sp.]|nr:MAG: ABC transporter permease [Pedobacter sp.]